MRPSAAPKKTKPERPGPEIQTGYAHVGRETWAAIAEELSPDGRAARHSEHQEPGPEIEVGLATAGRETLAAIGDDLLGVAAPPVRSAFSHKDRPTAAEAESSMDRATHSSDAPAPSTSVPPPRKRMRTLGFSDPAPAPDPSPPAPPTGDASGPLRKRPTQATLAAIERGLSGWANSGEPPAPLARSDEGKAAYEIFEMVTFVVRGDLARLSSSSARRRFVAERLMHRLPVDTMEEIDRVDVTPWTVHGTVVVRVWCRVPPG